MALILNIDTSTGICSLNIAKEGKCIAIREVLDDKSHAKVLTVLINELFEEVKIKPTEIEAVSVSKGPGSYTGLRIGVSTAKGLCYGGNISLIGISTLQALAYSISSGLTKTSLDFSKDSLFCPMIDARRMEVYSCLYDINNNPVSEIEARIITEESFTEILKNKKVYFFGNGSDKCKGLIHHKNAIFIENIITSASNMAELSEDAFNNQIFEDVAYFEPFYLKDFIATVSRKNMF